MEAPLVSVICVCYNHVRFVRASIESVFSQTFSSVQLIVVDDCSTDGSQDEILTLLKDRPDVIFLSLEKNEGNCRAFNRGFEAADGRFIIDLAADDVLVPDRIAQGVNAFARRTAEYGVQFSDAELISETGISMGYHSDRVPHTSVPEGDVYKDVIERYFINSPTMMFRREVMEVLGGYDETLAYEDFDFWIRSARHFKFFYIPEPLIRRRIVGNSMTRQQYKRNSPQLQSTFIICEKILSLNKTPQENKALKKRIWYELKKALAVGEFRLAGKYVRLWLKC